MTAGPGHNQPPSAIDLAAESFTAVGDWLKEHPVVQNEDDARSCKLMVDRASAALKEIETERDGKVRPLNEQVKAINSEYRTAYGPLDSLCSELKTRLKVFLDAEEIKLLREAEEARKALEVAEAAARAAEAKEQEAIDDAKQGVETDVAASTVVADAAFRAFEQASRFAARADKATKVRVAGGFAKALSIKNQEVLVVDDYTKAIETMGLTEKIKDAILSSARDYRKTFDELPDGVSATHERRL